MCIVQDQKCFLIEKSANQENKLFRNVCIFTITLFGGRNVCSRPHCFFCLVGGLVVLEHSLQAALEQIVTEQTHMQQERGVS